LCRILVYPVADLCYTIACRPLERWQACYQRKEVPLLDAFDCDTLA
jgi:hypothetical protein